MPLTLPLQRDLIALPDKYPHDCFVAFMLYLPLDTLRRLCRWWRSYIRQLLVQRGIPVEDHGRYFKREFFRSFRIVENRPGEYGWVQRYQHAVASHVYFKAMSDSHHLNRCPDGTVTLMTNVDCGNNMEWQEMSHADSDGMGMVSSYNYHEDDSDVKRVCYLLWPQKLIVMRSECAVLDLLTAYAVDTPAEMRTMLRA